MSDNSVYNYVLQFVYGIIIAAPNPPYIAIHTYIFGDLMVAELQ